MTDTGNTARGTPTSSTAPGVLAGPEALQELRDPVPGLADGPVLAVCAHPDDESFGLGAIIDTLVRAGHAVTVLCFTHGEASTLHGMPGELAAVRADELGVAAAILGVARTELLGYPDGGLAAIAPAELAAHVERVADAVGATTLLVFDTGGITGHPDHEAATAAALAAGPTGWAVLAWAVPEHVADALRAELGAPFVGRPPTLIDAIVPVDRARQHAAIAAHRSQSSENPVLWRRLELLGDHEAVRWLRRPHRTSTDDAL